MVCCGWASAKPTIRNLLDDWGQALGVSLVGNCTDETACQERLRALLHQRRLLLIIDNIWEVVHGQAFLLGGPYCRTLLTTANRPWPIPWPLVNARCE